MKVGNRARNSVHITTGSALALVLAACGGGGGSGSGSSPAIDSSNSAVVASRVYSVAEVLYSTGESAAELVDVKSAEASSGAARFSLAELAVRKLLDLESAKAGGARAAAKAVQADAGSCTLGGSFSETWNDADDSGTLSTGDSASLTFIDCIEDAGLRLNGTMALSNVSITGSDSTPSRSVGATFGFDRFQMSFGEGAAAVHGDMSLQAAITSSAPYTYDLSINGQSLAVTEGSSQETLQAYNATVRIDATAGTYAYGIGGMISGTALPAAITVATPSLLEGTIGAHPSTGVVTATASDGTAARLTATSAAGVTVDLDADADGSFESSQTLTWAQLAAM
jgi:hypothetical protein